MIEAATAVILRKPLAVILIVVLFINPTIIIPIAGRL
jgi:hypothetical protein